MAKNKDRRRAQAAADKSPKSQLDGDMRRHLDDLRLRCADDYLEWCRAHGFAPHLKKTRRQRQDELAHARRLHALARVRVDHGNRNPAHAIRELLNRPNDDVVCSELEPLAKALRPGGMESACQHFVRELLEHLLRTCARMLVAPRRTDCAAHAPGVDLVLRLAPFHGSVVRPIDTWKPRSHNEARRLVSVAHHLFAQWPVPTFLDGCWLESTAEAERARAWYVALGNGASVRSLELPISMTKRMAHELPSAPGHFSIPDALRWAQIRALGGTRKLAHAVRGTLLGRTFDNDAFWLTVLGFFVRNGIDQHGEISGMLDFLNYHRHAGEELVDELGNVEHEPPPSPGLCMRGRTAESLRRQVDEWHKRLGRGDANDRVRWVATGLPGYRAKFQQGFDKEIWQVRELLSAAELRIEGRSMRHCVVTYAAQCRVRRIAIWTMERHSLEGVQKQLTMEVCLRRMAIVQARGPCNRDPTPKERNLMERWAANASLTISPWA